MLELVAILLVIVLIPAVVYVHARLPVHTRDARATRILRVILIALGGLAMYLGAAWTVGESGLLRVAAMLCGFGVVHVPAFFVLYIKRLRGEYGSG